MAKQRGPDGVPVDIPTHKPQAAQRPHGNRQDDDEPTRAPSGKKGRLFPEEPPTRPAGSSDRSAYSRTDTRSNTDTSSTFQEEKRRAAATEPKTRIFRGGEAVRTSESAATGALEDPVTGWLVVVDGPGQGNFVRIGHGQNWIGRGEGSRIRLDFGDGLISRENSGAITYDPINRKFYIQQGTGANLLYLNSAPVLAPSELVDRAELRIGKTRLVFVAFCGEDFSWINEAE